VAKTEVVVLGSINIDTTLTVANLPSPGETIITQAVSRGFGGKGLNQAVAAAREGAATAIIACVGSDLDGEDVHRLLETEGIATTLIRTVDGATGSAVVMVDGQGENTIVVASLANDALQGLSPQDEEALANCEVLLCQLEVPMATVAAAMRTASGHGVITVLNAAPAMPLPSELSVAVSILVVNAGEARTIASSLAASDNGDNEFAPLLTIAPEVIVTRGAEGVDYLNCDGRRYHVSAWQVPVLDTTGAGDAFCGALCAGLATGIETSQAIQMGVLAGARAVQQPGTQARSTGTDGRASIDIAQSF